MLVLMLALMLVLMLILQVCGGNAGALCKVANWFNIEGDWHAGRLAGSCLL